MNRFSYPRWLVPAFGMIFIAGCSTPRRPPAVAPPPPAATTESTAPAAPPRPLPAVDAAAAAPAQPFELSAGPWVECSASDATVAVVVSTQASGIFRKRVGVHYLRPATPTILRLVRLTNGAPITVEQKEVPQACSSAFYLTSDDVYWTGTQYSIRSTLKQAPVDPAQSLTLDLNVRWRQSVGEEKHFEQKTNLKGVNHAIFGKGGVTATVHVVPPQSVSGLVPPPPQPEKQATAALVERLRAGFAGIDAIPDEALFARLLPARFSNATIGLSGNNLYLYPDYSYIYTSWTDVSPERIEEEGRWAFLDGILCLKGLSPGETTAAAHPPLDRYYLPVIEEKNPHDQPMLLGTNRGVGGLIDQPVNPSSSPPGTFALKSHAFSLVPPSPDQPACPTKEALRSATAAIEACWGPLEKIPHTSRRRSQRDGTLVLSDEATVAFADAVFASDHIEINHDCSLVKLRGPVVIDWNGRSIAAADAVIRLSPNLVQFESSDIRPR